MSRISLLSLLGIGTIVVNLTGCGAAFDSSAGGGGLASGANGAPVSLTNTVASAAQLQRGDIMQVVVAAGGSQRIDLSGLSSDTDLTVALVNLSSTGTAVNVGLQLDESAPLVRTVRASDTDALDVVDAPDFAASVAVDTSLQESFDQYLRETELALSADADAVILPSQSKAAQANAIQLGSTDQFRVVSSLSSLSQFREVTGVLRCIGDNVLIYVDSEVDGGAELSRADIDQLCLRFDQMATDEIAMIGAPSDLDGNGRVAVLLTPAVNRLGALGGGIITGFFFAADLQPRSGQNSLSNEGEILYLMVPDASGRFGTRVSRDVALSNLLPAVFPHELQHAISYNQHVLQGDGMPEASWLNEGISHLMEDVLGVGQENPSRYALYLNQPNLYGLTPATSPGLVARGGIFLLLRYLYEQQGASDSFVRALLQGGLVGVENLEAAAGQREDFDQMPEFLLRFATTLLLNNSGVSSDPRYQFAERVVTGDTFTGVCTYCNADDGRGTTLTGVRAQDLSASAGVSVPSSGMAFYHVSARTPSFVVRADSRSDVGVVVVRTR